MYVSLRAPSPPLPYTQVDYSRAVEIACVNDTVENRRFGGFTCSSGRPLTSRVLQHSFWDALFSRLGPEVASFIALWCPVVVQFEPSGGGLQVLGPPLKKAVPRTLNRHSTAGWRECCQKASRGEANLPPQGPAGLSAETPASPSLYGLNVSRLPLIGETAHCIHTKDHRAVHLLLEELWEEAHYKSIDSSSDTVPKLRCVIAAGDILTPCPGDCNVLALAKELVYQVFPYTLSGSDTSGDRFLRTYLTHILHCVIGSVPRMNIRGAAIKHTSFLEKRCLTAYFSTVAPVRLEQGEAGDKGMHKSTRFGELTVPENIVASYICTLLGAMWWRTPCNSSYTASNSMRVGFWGAGGTVMEKMYAVTVDWLRCGKQQVFPLSHFLHEVPVSSLPWLRGFYTKVSTDGRRRRSMIQQRIYLQLVFFLFQNVIPFLLTRSFHVVYNLKNSNVLLFIPKPVWSRLVRREMWQICVSGRKRMRDEGAVHEEGGKVKTRSLRRMSLERVTASELVRTGAIPEPTSSRDIGASKQSVPLLVSDVHFMLDGAKLRPVARIRFASRRSLLRIADGVPTSFTRSTATVPHIFRMTRPTTPRPSPNSTVLRDALRCLLAGVEEHRVEHGQPNSASSSHNKEYLELRSFIETSRRFCAAPCLVGNHGGAYSSSADFSFSMIRGDGARCFECLPQETIMKCVRRLISHEQYHMVRLTSIMALPRSGGDDVLTNSGGRWPRAECHRLQLGKRVVALPDSGLRAGVLLGIPEGCVMYEETTTMSDSTLSGEVVRSTLQHHLQTHFVVMGNRLYVQRLGITQGSAVASLLCDTLLESVVVSLCDILSEQEEPSLVLRRMDDILVVTLSPVAALRCEDAIRSGWPEVGFICQMEKLRNTARSGGGNLVQWCGLLWDPQSLELSVEWARLACLVPHIHVCLRSGSEPLFSSLRFMNILRLRTPMTVLCRRINSKPRVIQTLYEICLLWSRFFLGKLAANASFIRPHVRTVLRPLTVALAMLQRLVHRRARTLSCTGSFCDVTKDEIQLCMFSAFHLVLQGRLGWLIDRMHRARKYWRRFILVVETIVRHKMKGTAALMKERGDEGFTTVASMLAADDTDSIATRALRAVRFAPPRGY
uniref:Telomerase reverse transcriptase n=1 Tax=Trypanosoma vivax (strain Y486) TaxID=1055687 RepID=G0UCR0_TRYVY|nr:putative telomerase reverse transcriptase [Trypanosoma vivax Y486]